MKDKCPIVLFGQNPFSSDLIQSARKYYRYQWIWFKNTNSNFLRPKERPLNHIQDILVFSKKPCPNYYPQMELREKPYHEKTKGTVKSTIYSLANDYKRDALRTHNYPKNVLTFKSVHKPKPFEKPLNLMEYLVKTYSLENDTVLDFTMGTGTTGVACNNLNRKFIGIERNKEIFEIAKSRCS